MGKQLHEPVTIASSDARTARKSSSILQDVFSSRRRMLIAAAWMLLLLAAFSAATFAWFSSSRYTNVTPVAHAVSDSGYDLLIGASQGGPFDTECALSQTDKTLYPISTADFTPFWRGTFQNANGITTEYANCTANVGSCCLMAAIIAPSYFQTPCSGGFFIFRAWKPPVPMAPISNRCLPIPWANRGNAPDRVVFFSPYGPFMEKSVFVCRKSRNPRVETPPQWA